MAKIQSGHHLGPGQEREERRWGPGRFPGCSVPGDLHPGTNTLKRRPELQKNDITKDFKTIRAPEWSIHPPCSHLASGHNTEGRRAGAGRAPGPLRMIDST
ncbi:unnamed protein product [Gadus morhua 'NCC']